MANSRIRSAAARVLRRAPTRTLTLDDLSRRIAEEERISMTPDALVAALRDHDSIVLLERISPLGTLPMLVHEHAPAYDHALGCAHGCYAVIDARERDGSEPSTIFDTLAAPLLQVWRDASANALLRGEIADALGGLFSLVPTIDDAQARVR